MVTTKFTHLQVQELSVFQAQHLAQVIIKFHIWSLLVVVDLILTIQEVEVVVDLEKIKVL
mgnify:CR=1 FL=1